MKTIEIDDELYQYIAGNTKFIGESASDILRRLLQLDRNQDIEHTMPVAATRPEAEAVAEHSDSDETVSDVARADDIEQDNVEVVQASDTAAPLSSENKTSEIQNVFDLINKEELAAQRGAVGRFLLILSNLYRVHKGEFEQVLDIRGRDRLYFAKSDEALREAGSSTKPKLIPNSEYWVITNSNTTKKKRMLTDVAVALGYAASDAERIREML
ncbi:replication initiation negative regulator SeqA [Thalassotalea maritima]|uniref:replication initiation negative regulator SeqA n=1 Tax=Thalassotalea maritima TaxID=3242416 RepID=UPI003528E654